jgi:hypothetical protein
MAMTKKDKIEAAVKRAGVEGPNKPKRTPSHPTKSHIVVAVEGDKVKTIRFGQQGVTGSPARKGESEADKAGVNHSKPATQRTSPKGR